MNLTRRNLVLGAVTAALVVRLPPVLAQTDPSATFVAGFGRDLVAIVNGPGSAEAKAAQMETAIERSVDVDAIARFCLGRFVRQASPAQLADYTRLFHRVLARTITGHIGDYRGVSFTVGRTLPNADGHAVLTVVVRPGQAPAQVQWVVAKTDGGPKVVDVVAEGTSLRLTQRSDYGSFLSRNGGDVAALIAAMKRQTGQA